MACDRRYGLTSQKMPSSVDPSCIGDLLLSSDKGQELKLSTSPIGLTKKGNEILKMRYVYQFSKMLCTKAIKISCPLLEVKKMEEKCTKCNKDLKNQGRMFCYPKGVQKILCEDCGAELLQLLYSEPNEYVNNKLYYDFFGG